ncbi:MAG TPA: cyclic nucleotide-binding domain-containing protein, partial [Sorangium sp.]|nr:cyclic nucleotide-binding domain-containing protein [Sorangium sp.]
MPSSDHTRGDGRDAASDRARAWPPGVFDAPVLRGLDERARREIAEAGRLRALSPDEVAYRAGDAGDAFFVVASGRVALRATRRGDDRETEVRTAAVGDVLGEEAVVGMSRRTTAVALAESVLAEVPVHLFRRAAGRSGKADIAEKLERALRRSATRDLLGTLAFTRDLDPDDIEILLDAVSHRRFERGQAVYRAGDPAAELWLIAEGMVQVQTEDGDRIHVRAYLTRGDFFGDVELGEGRSRAASAVASGAATLLSVPAKTFASLARKHPDLIPRLRRITGEQSAAQEAIVAGHARNHTAHVFRDLYRLQVARSLLVIDLETCARCGHCAWSCADVHGVSRLARRGDKVLARVDDDDDAAQAARHGAPRSLLLPNSCQHCESPACMIECPTGAIGKDTGGEVFIRDALCTGCGACAKACPWDNIAMAPRPPDAPRPGGAGFPDLAVKCDLCRDHDGPACVKACPTGSIFRVNPAEEIADVRDLLGGARREQERAGAPRSDAALLAGSAIAAA